MAISAKENLLRAIRHEAADHVPYWSEGSYVLVDCRGRRPPREGLDEWGVAWAPLPETYVAGAGEPAFSYPVAHPAQSVAELIERPFPDPRDPACFAGLLKGIDKASVLAIGRHPAGPFDRLVSLVGMPNALVATLSDPVATRAVLDRLADYHVEVARGYLAAGAEGGWLADDYAGQSGPFISPTVWRRLVLPGLQRILAVYREAGVPAFFHTCGRAEALLPDLIEAGVTAFNLESAVCDLGALKARFGRRIAFVGGLSPEVMLRGQPADVRREALRAMSTLGGEGGLILAPDQELAYPPENEAALVETARQHGAYPLRI